MELMKRILTIEDPEERAAEAALSALRQLRWLKHGVFGISSGAANE
jgi:hypothetical protein